MAVITAQTLEEWKARCEKSSHLRPGEHVNYHHNEERGTIAASIYYGEKWCCSLGYYFTTDQVDRHKTIPAGSGWLYD